MRLFRFQVPAIAPLILNGYALVLNVWMTAVLGIVFWMVATRLYSQEQVGLAAALISSMTTISYFSQMNLSSFLTRFLPASESGAGLLIAKTYAVTGLMSALFALVFAAGVGLVAKPLEVIGADAGRMFLFVAATVLWTVFALEDAVLSGLRRAVLVPISNTVYAAAKIGLLLGLSALSLSPPLGIFMAWTIPLLPVVIVVNAMIFGRLGRLQSEVEPRGPDVVTARRFWGWDFLGSLALGAAFSIAPLMVTAAAGVKATASYHMAWSFAYSIYLVGRAMSTSLVAEGATDPIRLRRLIADSLSHTLLLLSASVAVILVFAPQIMGLFGPAYVVEGGAVLRLLALSCLPWSVTTIYCAAARVRRQTRSVALVQVGTLIVFVAVSVLLVTGYGAQGVALGWLVAHTAICACIVLRIYKGEGWIGLVHWGLSIASSALQLTATLPRPDLGRRCGTNAIAAEVIAGLERSPLHGMTPVCVTGALTDVAVFMLYAGSASEAKACAVLKFSASRNGIAALRRNAAALRSLAGDPRLGPHAELLPRMILDDSWGPFFCTAETAVPGIEGRKVLRQGRQVAAAMATVAATLADMHRRTATACRLDNGWARDWIDEPLDIVARTGGNRAAALALLQAELRDIFVGREVLLGFGHGDVWPGNLFFAVDRPEVDPPRLTGLVDWDTYRSDALVAIDACQLGLALRMERSGEELGSVVRALLHGADWAGEETAIFAAAGLQAELGPDSDPALRRGILLLTWLRHVAMVIGQSEDASSRRFWLLMNMDLVLATLPGSARQGLR